MRAATVAPEEESDVIEDRLADPALLEAVAAIARRAGALVMEIYDTDFAVRGKADASPVTEADERAEALIVPALQALAPDVPVVAEEAVAAGAAPAVGDWFWLVDPLDGTKEFVSRNGEFTVNVALVRRGEPVLGVVLAPALGRLFAGAAGQGAWVEDAGGRRPIRCHGGARSSGPDRGRQPLARRRGCARRLSCGAQGRGAGERRLVS